MLNTVGLFTSDELDRIEDIGHRLPPLPATVVSPKPAIHRSGKIAWIHPEPEYRWIYLKVMAEMNKLGPFEEMQSLQFTIYGKGDFYKKHRDNGPSEDATVNRRCVSAVLQLSEPKHYDGGTLLLYDGSSPILTMKMRGLLTVFSPSVFHEVTEVTRGLRNTLVCWGLKADV